MRKVTFILKKYFTHEGHAQLDRERAERRGNRVSSTGGTRSGGTSTPSSNEYEWPSGGNPTRGHRPPPSGVTVSDRPIGQQRQRRTRRRRRTASPVGLPIYSEEPRDQEMSLFKHQTTDLSMSSSRLELTLSPTIEVDNVSDDEDEGDSPERRRNEELEVEDSASEFVRPSFDNSASEDHGIVSSSLSPSPLPPSRPRSASESLVRMSSRNPYGGNSSSPFASRSGLIDLPPGQLSPTVSRDGTSTPPRSGFLGHRTTRSSPISAMARRASSPPRPNFSRPRASTLQRVLGARNSSSSFLPNGSTGTSPYGQNGGGGSPSLATASGANSPIGGRSLRRFATASTTSVNTLDISEPVPGSFVHSSFVFPKNGPTPEQVKFIASRENLGAYGYFGETPPAFDSPSSPGSPSPSTPPLSLSPLVDGVSAISLGRPISMVQTTTPGRGRSGSTASSPLARRRSPSPPGEEGGTRRHSLARETGRDEEDEDVGDGDLLPFTVDEEEEEETNTSNELPPISPISPISFDLSTIRPGASSGDSHMYPVPPPFNRLNTSSPPPRIVTESATPIHSAHPSPALPQEGFSTTLADDAGLDQNNTIKVQA
ncbi:uncharacterized protein JCM6883_005086 [Sporobolomyces salmoneus]|uniref:uncharacterized protein n=1 Tax=Sporobolomyces salmoneus TaxID=183962 RepID=UPI0031707A94